MSDVHCVWYSDLWHVSRAYPWLWFPCLGPIEHFQALPHWDPVVWLQWWWRICCWCPLKKKIQILNLISLMCASEKTNCCVLKVHELDLNYTLDNLTRNKRLIWVTYCMLYKKHTQTNRNAGYVRNNIHRPKGVSSTSACESSNANFPRGLWCAWVPLDQPVSPCHPHIKDSLREERSILALAKEGIQEILLERQLSLDEPQSICPSLRQKTQTLHADHGSTASGAADAGLWMDCTTAGRADPQIQLSFRPTSCAAPMWASHF